MLQPWLVALAVLLAAIPLAIAAPPLAALAGVVVILGDRSAPGLTRVTSPGLIPESEEGVS